MAVLKDLIVHGPSRFINTANFNSIKANTIGADNGVFNKLIATSADIGSLDVDDLTAQNATVVGLLDVKGQLHTNSWTNANIANIGGSFYISPTVSTEIAANGTPMSVTISEGSGNRTIAVSGGAFVTDSVKIYQNKTTSTASWAIGSRVMITGNVRLGTTGTDYPLGTCIGYLNAPLTTSGFTIAEVNSPALESIISTIGTSLKSYNIKISMYEIGPKTSEKPVGILLTSYGVDRSTYIDIYGGVNTKNSSGYTEPNVRIGYLGGIPSYTDSAGKPHKPTGWGLFTDNGYFKGVIVADSGSIGGTTINATSFYSLVDGTGYSFSNGGEFSITGTDDSYIKMEQTDNDGEIENTLSVQLSKLYMTLGEIYGQDETINVIEVINDQITFSQLWEGSSVWLYKKDGNTFDVYEYINTNGELEYYYDNNQFNPGYYELTDDSEISSSKDYYKPSLLSNNPNNIISLYNYENLNIKSLVVDIDPVQSGSGDPSPTNVRPISGWDGVNVWNTGKNFVLFPYESASGTYGGIQVTMQDDGGIKLNGTCTSSSWIRLATLKLKAGTYTLSPSRLADCNLITQKNGAYWFGGGVNGGITKTLDETATIIVSLAITSGKTYNGTIYPQFELGSSVTSFEIGHGQSYSIPFKDSEDNPITVYGGNMNITAGEGERTMAMVDLGDLTWSAGSDSRHTVFFARFDGLKYVTDNVVVNAISSQYKAITKVAWSGVDFDTDNVFRSDNSAEILYFRNLAYTDATAFKQAMQGVQLCYELATPTPIYCEPTEIKTLKGNNNVWADSGKVEVELNMLYQEVEPISNPAAENFYEFVTNPEDWQKYTGDISNLTEKLKDGLQSALSFTTDSLQNEQKLLISSGHEKDESETVSIEVDPSFISLIANSEDLTMQFRMNHDTLTNTANIQIIDKEEEIFSIEDKNGYALSTTTGFKAGPLGMFHYKKGLAIGMI